MILYLPHKLLACALQHVCGAVDHVLRQRPVACFGCVSRAREEGTVVAGPELGREEDMFELLAAGEL